MDYYEELGLSHAASLEEIRHAYRQLARLIHPDQQPDERLRQLAEIQMRRLNRILEILADPVQRREYDRGLAPAVALVRISPPTSPPPRGVLWEWLARVDRGVWIWAGASLVGIAAILIFFAGSSGARPVQVRDAAPIRLAHPVQMPSVQLPRVQLPRDGASAVRTTPRLPRPSPAATPRADESRPELPPQPEIAMEPRAAMPEMPMPRLDQPPGFAGNWLYAPAPGAAKPGRLYAPEFVEVKITGQDGRIYGLYRARYLVTDKAISPAVVFHFEGRATVPKTTLDWMGSGGASGRVTLKLVSENSLEVDWTAQQLSHEIELVSGTATLVRRKDPAY